MIVLKFGSDQLRTTHIRTSFSPLGMAFVVSLRPVVVPSVTGGLYRGSAVILIIDSPAELITNVRLAGGAPSMSTSASCSADSYRMSSCANVSNGNDYQTYRVCAWKSRVFDWHARRAKKTPIPGHSGSNSRTRSYLGISRKTEARTDNSQEIPF